VKVFVEGIGVCGPGLDGWEKTSAILRGLAPYEDGPAPQPKAEMLPPAERRRSSATIRLAVSTTAEATRMAGEGGEKKVSVFASSGGDGELAARICEALAKPEKAVSPFMFHNSVHNAPSGYWGIASQSMEPSNSISCGNGSFAGGLLEAATFCAVDGVKAILAVYDYPSPPPLFKEMKIDFPFAMAFVLSPYPSPCSIAALDMHALPAGPSAAVSTMDDPRIEAVRMGNPAARSLPVLSAIANGESVETVVEYVDGLVMKVRVAQDTAS